MSLARAVLVLACAAPLLAARAPATVSASADGPVTVLASFMRGSRTEHELNLPPSVIPAGVHKARLDIPNNCAPLALKGQRVTVSDDAVSLRLVPPPDEAFTPFTVIREGPLPSEAYVVVIQYCQ